MLIMFPFPALIFVSLLNDLFFLSSSFTTLLSSVVIFIPICNINPLKFSPYVSKKLEFIAVHLH